MDDRAWWRTTCWLAAAVLFLWIVFGVVLQIFDEGLGVIDAFGFPLGYFLATLVAPVVMAMVLFAFVERQKVVDRRHGFGED